MRNPQFLSRTISAYDGGKNPEYWATEIRMGKCGAKQNLRIYFCSKCGNNAERGVLSRGNPQDAEK